MKYTLLVLLSLFTGTLFAQMKHNIAGHYNRSHKGDPQGASGLFILPDHRYAITYFGGAQIGTWETKHVKKGESYITGDVVIFTPSRAPYPYALYGRHNNKIGDSTRIFFAGFSEDENFIQWNGNTSSAPVLQRVFNKGANCLSYANIQMLSNAIDSLTLTYKPFGERDETPLPPLYHFVNKDKYNDFVAYYFEQKNDDRPFMALIVGDSLQFGEHDFSAKRPMPKGETQELIDQLLQINFSPDTVYYNPWYNQCQEKLVMDTFNYLFSAEKNAYINFLNYTEGYENVKGENAFNEMFIVYPFQNIRSFNTVQQAYTIDEKKKPLFVAKCQEEPGSPAD